MKFLILSFFLFFSNSVYSQLECIEGIWYYHELITDLGDNDPVSSINPPIQPTIIIDGSLSYSGFIACNDYSGNFTVVNDNVFTSNNFTRTDNDCELGNHNAFENFYASFFEDDNFWGPLLLTSCESELIFETSNGYGLIYRRFPPLSVNDPVKSYFNLFPNPASTSITISSETLKVDNLLIYNTQGELLQTVKGNNIIDVSSLSSGIYFVKVISEEKEHVQRFIKK